MALALRLSADQILARIPKTSMSIASDTSHRSIPIELLRIRKYLLKQRFKYPGRSFTRLLLLVVQRHQYRKLFSRSSPSQLAV